MAIKSKEYLVLYKCKNAFNKIVTSAKQIKIPIQVKIEKGANISQVLDLILGSMVTNTSEFS